MFSFLLQAWFISNNIRTKAGEEKRSWRQMFAHPWETSLASLRLCSHVKLLPKTFFKIHLDNSLLVSPTKVTLLYASVMTLLTRSSTTVAANSSSKASSSLLFTFDDSRIINSFAQGELSILNFNHTNVVVVLVLHYIRLSRFIWIAMLN